MGASKIKWTTHDPRLVESESDLKLYSKGRFTPRGRANSLCNKLEILTFDWPKGSNRVPTPLHIEAGLIWWYTFLIKKYVMTRPELIELGAPKMEGQFLA
jgi:hypothetical protein